MAKTTLSKTGLNKQDEGDLDWETALNSGFDNLESRIGKSYAGDPNGNVAAEWLGQTCHDTNSNELYRATATGSASNTAWEKLINENNFVSNGGVIAETSQSGGETTAKLAGREVVIDAADVPFVVEV